MNATTAPATAQVANRWQRELAWHRLLLPRAASLWQFKTIGISGILTVFFAGYFALQSYPLFAVTLMPVTALDRLIAFQPGMLLLYVTLWLYLSLPPGLLDNRRDLLGYYAGMAGLALAGMAVFLLWPTASPRPLIDWDLYPFVGPVFGPLIAVDHAGNALPSLHAAFAVFTAIWFDRMLRHPGDIGLLRAVNALWCLGILYSTLATKQHVAVDIYAGAVFGAVAAWLHGRWFHLPPRFPERGA